MIVQPRCVQIVYTELCDDWYMLRKVPMNSIKHFIDIGASFGLISIAFKLLNPRSKVTAIEPYDKVYENLVENTRGLFIRTLNIALGDGSMFYLLTNRKTPTNNEYRKTKGDTEKAVKSETLGGIIKLCRADPDDLMIKCDCEGAEQYLMCDEASRDIMGRLKVLVMELHKTKGENKDDFSPTPQELTEFYRDKPYTVKIHERSEITCIIQIIRNGVLI